MLTLSRGADSLVIAPESGGAIVGWMRGGRNVLRRAAPEAVLSGDPGAMACFPLVPFANRVAARRFVWRGETHVLAPNFGDHPHAIHGTGWKARWTAVSVSPESVTLTLAHRGGEGWPFAFAATLIYRLTPAGLSVEMAATNRHTAAAPMGLGLHPYFPRPAGAVIRFDASGVWINDATQLPVRHGAVPPAWDAAAGRPVDAAPLDNCFTSWPGIAGLPDLRLEADPVFGNLQVYTPAGQDFFCAEPVSHAPDAINRDPMDMTVLAPGETLRGTIRFLPAA